MLSNLCFLRKAILLGLLSSNERNVITFKSYSNGNGFQSVDHNNSGLWQWEQDIVSSYFSCRFNLLVAGAGGGREAIALARQSFHVTAFDSCRALTKACRSHIDTSGLEVRVLEAAPDSVPAECLSGHFRYDGIYVGRGCYHHIPGRSRRVAFLKGCRQLIGLGAPLFLSDFFTRQVDDRSYQRIFMIANTVRRLNRKPDAVELGDWLSDCMQHAFVISEIESELVEAGFRLAHFAESPCGPDSHLAHAVGISQ